jgi:hypothetical protein
LSANFKGLKAKEFENGIYNLQINSGLTDVQIRAVKKLEIAEPEISNAGSEFLNSLHTEVQKVIKQRGFLGKTYLETNFIPATSSEVERLFSRAKFIRTAHRTRLDLENFEALLYLFYNRKFWDKATVAKVL